MSSLPDGIASRLVERARDRLIVRAVVYPARDGGARRRVLINLVSFCSEGGEESNRLGRREGFFRVAYECDVDARYWHTSIWEFNSSFLGESPSVAREAVATWLGTCGVPSWKVDDEVVICLEDPDMLISRLPPSNLYLMLHYIRLYDWLMGAHNPNNVDAWCIDTFVKRLGAFIYARTEEWKRVVG